MKDEQGKLHFDADGNIIKEKLNKRTEEDTETMSSAMRPLLEFIDGYRRRVAAPENTLIRKKYSKYADLTYI